MEELEHLMEIFDTDGDGSIFWQEFVEWCDDRVPLSMEKMRKILGAHEGNTTRRFRLATKAPSAGYMREWLKVHAAEVNADITSVAQGSEAMRTSPLVVGRCRSTLSRPLLKAPLVSALESRIS